MPFCSINSGMNCYIGPPTTPFSKTLSTQAIHTLIAIVESLKSNEVTVENSISTSAVVSKLDGEDGRIVLKAQLVILLGKAEEVEETAVPVVAA